jgi:hypothetical protein
MSNPYDIAEQRKRVYLLCFGSPAGQVVLRDLARAIFADCTEFNADPRLHVGQLEQAPSRTKEVIGATDSAGSRLGCAPFAAD